MRDLGKNLIDNLGIELSGNQEKQFYAYLEFLNEFNSHTNLTRIPEKDIPLLHFYDSLTAVEFVDFIKVKTLIDIGTGAGFPGVPLKIIFPHLKVTLVDARYKKVKFLHELIHKLGLEGIEAVHARAEELAKGPSYRQRYMHKFDIVTARAVAEVKELIKLLRPFKSANGRILLYKGPKTSIELKNAQAIIKRLNVNIEEHSITLPGEGHSRSLLLVS